MTLRTLIEAHARITTKELVEAGKLNCGRSWSSILTRRYARFARELKREQKRRKKS